MSRPRIGLALGAGGTKGVAHVGVLKVLQEAGIHIDCVAGASVGALYAAGYAVGRPVESMMSGTRRSSPWQVFRFFWHGLSLHHDNPVARAYLSAFQGHRCEELRLPFAAVASDVEDPSPVVLREGDLVRALEASIAIPVLARPVPWEGRWLVDGGFWEAAPVSTAAALGAERVIAVVLGEPVALTRWLRPLVRWLAQRVRRLSKGRPPGRLASLSFLLHTLSEPPPAARPADVTIRPDVTRLSANSPFHMGSSLERGEAAARAALPQIRALLKGQPEAAAYDVPEA
jgi:predicted acylesterase/phospholipase RssA